MFKKLRSFFSNLLRSNQPKAKLKYVDGKLAIKSYNSAFVEKQRATLGDLTFGKSDEEVIQLYLQRENLVLEEPKLTVEHMGIDEDGRIQMKLDWNQAFIKLLAKNGIVSENEEEAVQAYLLKLTMDVAEDMGLPNKLSLTQDDVAKAFSEQDAEMEREMQEAAEQARQMRKPRRRTVKRTQDPEQ